MGSQNHIYSKKKLIKWKQGRAREEEAAARPRSGHYVGCGKGKGMWEAAWPGGLFRGWDLVLERLWGGEPARGAGEHQMMVWVRDRREHGGTHGWGGVWGC